MEPDDDDRLPPVEQLVDTLYAQDRASQKLGMKIEDVRRGYARLSMTVQKDMTNGHDIGHGGMTFTLADSAMAFASNSYDKVAVAQSATIHFLAPVKAGDRLVATAQVQSRSRRSAVWDVTVDTDDGRAIALFRGITATLNRSIL